MVHRLSLSTGNVGVRAGRRSLTLWSARGTMKGCWRWPNRKS